MLKMAPLHIVSMLLHLLPLLFFDIKYPWKTFWQDGLEKITFFSRSFELAACSHIGSTNKFCLPPHILMGLN